MMRLITFKASIVAVVAFLAMAGFLTSFAVAEAPLKILFIGNSFTNGGPIPTLVRDLAVDAGWAAPNCVNAAVNSQTLQWHIANPGTVAYIDQGGWDYVVLQEYSTRPTVSSATNSNPAQFEHDVLWLYDRIKVTSPNAIIVLYETWARHENLTSYYPVYYPNRDDMQNQLNYWYHHAAEVYVPTNSISPIKEDIFTAPVGEAWALDYHGLNYNLHESDLYHANTTGQYLNALVIYGMIYERSVVGRSYLGRNATYAAYLQTLTDQVTGQTQQGGPAPGDNRRPSVNAGPDRILAWPTKQVTLDATVTDDGMPNPPGVVTVAWSKVSGPGGVTFTNPNVVDATATFTVGGAYVLRLTADDGEFWSYDEVTVTVNDESASWLLVMDNGDVGYSEFGGYWWHGSPEGYQSDIAGATNLANGYATYTFNGLPTARYEVLTTYVASGNRNSAVPYTVYEGTIMGTSLGTFIINQQVSPSGYNYDGWKWSRLGSGSFRITEGTLTVKIAVVSGQGYSMADGVMVRLVQSILGDFNGDELVDLADYTTWADHFGGSDSVFAPGSSNGDGMVDLGDYTTWADHFGETATLLNVSESAP